VVNITSPVHGATVPKGQTVTISASASDNVGVRRVEFYVNGALACPADLAAPYSCAWRVPSAAKRSYTLESRAYDAAGNVGRKSISVTSR
jgi:chitinase